MKTDSQLAEKLTAEHESYLQSAGDGLVEAILEGVKEGAAEGLKEGAKDALKECLTRGFTNIEAPAIKDILEDIPQEMVESSVKKGTKRIFKKSTESYIKKACQNIIKKMQKEGIKLSQKEADHILKIFKRSEREALEKIIAKVPQNPLFNAIIAGMQAALEESLEKNFAAYAQENLERATMRAEKRRTEIAESDELKESVKSLVKKIVGKIVYKLVKASAKKTVAELRNKLKEETIHKIEEKLKEAAENQLEKQLTKSSQKLQIEIAQDNPQGSDYISQMQQSFEKDCHNFLSSLKGLSALKVAAISCACALLIGAGVYFGIGPTPSSQPDLVITWSEPEWISGEDIVISYTIANQGEAEARGSYTRMFVGGSLFTEDYVAPLGPGEERDMLFYAYDLYDTDAPMELCADGRGNVDESNEENNCVTIKLMPPPSEEEEEEVITLMYASPFPATGGRGLRENYYLDWVEEQSGGRVQFERFPDGLLAGVPEQYGLISSGAADLGPMILSTVPDLPLTYLPVISIAGTGADAAALARAINEHPEISALLQAEWTAHNLTFLGKEGIYFTGGSPDGVGEGIIFKDPFDALADLEGERLGSVGSHPELEALGITVVPLEQPDFFGSLATGVIDGALGSAGQFIEWSLQEVAKHFMAFPLSSVSGGGFMAMNLESWNSLPTDIQDIFIAGEAVMYEFSLEQMVLDKQSYIDMFEAVEGTMGILPVEDALVILESRFEERRAEYLTICENAGKLAEAKLIVKYIDEIMAAMGLI